MKKENITQFNFNSKINNEAQYKQNYISFYRLLYLMKKHLKS